MKNRILLKSAPIPRSTGPDRLVFLDVVRVVAVLGIILFHFHPAAFVAGAAPGTVPALTVLRQPLGDLGVTLFIILSAAALTGRDRAGEGGGGADRLSLADFWVKRFLAIFPSYWIAYAAVALALLASRGNWAAGIAPWKFAFSALGLDGFLFHGRSSPYLVGEWFVGFILCLYALFPLLRRGASTRPWLTAGAIGVLFVVLHRHYDAFFTLMENRNPLMRLPEFFFGLCFFRHVRPRLGRWAAASAAVVLALAAWTPPWSALVQGIALGVACFCLLAFAAERARIPPRLAALLGVASTHAFLAFLVHHQIIQAVRLRFTAPLDPLRTALLFAFVVAASFLVAAALMPLVGRFTALLGRWLRPGPSRRRTVLAGESVLLAMLVGGIALDFADRSPSMSRKLAAIASRLGPAPAGAGAATSAFDPARWDEAIERRVRDAGIGMYGTDWWRHVGTLRYSAQARDDRRCDGRVDLLAASGPQRGAQGWVTTTPPRPDVLIVLTGPHDETVGYGVSGQARPDVRRAIPGARRDAGWVAIADAPPVHAHAYVDGRFCRIGAPSAP